jgi:hypothetical protein
MLQHLSGFPTFARAYSVLFADLIMIDERARLGWGIRLHLLQPFPH